MMAVNQNTATILSKKQQRLTLNAKKKTLEKSLRNVITLPYEKYWPVVTNGEDVCIPLVTLLQTQLQKLHIIDEKIPISSLKGKSTAERRELKKHAKEKKESCEQFREVSRLRGQLLLGVNAVARSLEGGKVAALLVAADADPPLMVLHLVGLAGRTRVPTVVLGALRSTCASSMGFACIALGLRSCATEASSDLFSIYQEVSRLSSQFPLPQSISMFSVPVGPDLEDPPALTQGAEKSVRPGVAARGSVPPGSDTKAPAENLHLLRPKAGTRAFIPGGPSAVEGSHDFISLGDAAEETPSRETLKGISGRYQPLQVKRIKPNPNKKRNSKKRKKNGE